MSDESSKCEYRELGPNEAVREGDELNGNPNSATGWVRARESVGDKVADWPGLQFRRRVSQQAAAEDGRCILCGRHRKSHRYDDGACYILNEQGSFRAYHETARFTARKVAEELVCIQGGETKLQDNQVMSDITLIKEDVSVCPINDTECEQCGGTATHSVMLDLRGNGSGVNVGYFCETCATEAAKRLQATLPSEVEAADIDTLRQKLAECERERDELKASNNFGVEAMKVIGEDHIEFSRLEYNLAMAQETINTLRAEVARLREALGPFARLAAIDAWSHFPDNFELVGNGGKAITMRDARAAEAALTEGKEVEIVPSRPLFKTEAEYQAFRERYIAEVGPALDKLRAVRKEAGK